MREMIMARRVSGFRRFGLKRVASIVWTMDDAPETCHVVSDRSRCFLRIHVQWSSLGRNSLLLFALFSLTTATVLLN